MSGVDPTVADWLKSEGLSSVATSSGAAAFGSIALDSIVRCPFDSAIAAADEAARQIAFLGGPRVRDRLRVAGRQAGLIGQTVTLTADHAGYRTGAAVFVIAADEGDDGGTELHVLRRLA